MNLRVKVLVSRNLSILLVRGVTRSGGSGYSRTRTDKNGKKANRAIHAKLRSRATGRASRITCSRGTFPYQGFRLDVFSRWFIPSVASWPCFLILSENLSFSQCKLSPDGFWFEPPSTSLPMARAKALCLGFAASFLQVAKHLYKKFLDYFCSVCVVRDARESFKFDVQLSRLFVSVD